MECKVDELAPEENLCVYLHASHLDIKMEINSLTQGCQTHVLSRANYALGFGLEGHKFLKDLVVT